MSIERIYYQEPNFVLTLIYGKLTSGELADHVGTMNTEYAGIAGIKELADCRYLYDVSELSAEGLFFSAENEKGSTRVIGGKGAIVASSDVIYGLARMYSAIASNIREDSQAFRTLDEAIEFLDISNLMEILGPELSESSYKKRLNDAGFKLE